MLFFLLPRFSFSLGCHNVGAVAGKSRSRVDSFFLSLALSLLPSSGSGFIDRG